MSLPLWVEGWVRGADWDGIAFATLPAFIYLFIEKVMLRGNTAVMGARYVMEVKGTAGTC